MTRNGMKAWVLAEWLTALALLAMVAMIALPNFFEAKTRSNVSQVLADLRRLETAHTSYRLDNGRWMPDLHDYVMYQVPPILVSANDDPFIYGRLTTPVAYLGDVPLDPLRSGREVIFCYSYYGLGWHRAVEAAGSSTSQDKFLGQWLFHSPGPDRIHDYGEWITYIPEREANGGASPREYDPSNGIVSQGDIVRWENMERTLVTPDEPES